MFPKAMQGLKGSTMRSLNLIWGPLAALAKTSRRVSGPPLVGHGARPGGHQLNRSGVEQVAWAWKPTIHSTPEVNVCPHPHPQSAACTFWPPTLHPIILAHQWTHRFLGVLVPVAHDSKPNKTLCLLLPGLWSPVLLP